MIRLSQNVLDELRKNSAFRLRVQGTISASHNTMMKYIDENDIRLTALDAVNVITDHMQLPLSKVITGGKLST
jgi:hypothetical protein